MNQTAKIAKAATKDEVVNATIGDKQSLPALLVAIRLGVLGELGGSIC
jgi:hypothetical protein